MSTPRIKSFDQYLGDAISAFLAEKGVNDISRTSIMLSFLRANALLTSRASGDLLQILRDDSVDRASGETLLRYAFDENVKILNAKPSTGLVTIQDKSFKKISTKLYSGANAPNANTTILKVSDASKFPNTGKVYIGRGTSNIEGPIDYSQVNQVGGFWEITLDTPTTRFHNTSETVILAQKGNRIISNAVVKAPSMGGSPEITFSVENDILLQDGEDTISGVSVTCLQVGSAGNVPRYGIKEFNVDPFQGATVFNETPFISGRDPESEESIRARIKLARLSRGLGVESAIRFSVQGSQAPDEASIATSVQVVRSPSKTTVYVDDGSGYERKTQGMGMEVIVDKALGGESEFSLTRDGRTTSIAKAYLLTENTQPYEISGGDRLAVAVGGELFEHTFDKEDFKSQGSATAYEVVASINANSDLGFSASTSGGGQKVTLSAKSEAKSFIEVKEPTFGKNANDSLIFPDGEVDTVQLYKNNVPLSKDGRVASVFTNTRSSWSPLIASGATLSVRVDNTSFVTYTFTNQDFIDEGSFNTVSSQNTLESWVNVFNNKLIGVTARVTGQTIELFSNKGENNKAKIEIDLGSSLVADGMFSDQDLTGQGIESDYELSRVTGQLKLKVPLKEGDRLTAGIDDSEAFLSSDVILGGMVNILNDAYLWLVVDDHAETITHGVAEGTLLTVSKPAQNIIRYTSSSPTAFLKVEKHDYTIISSKELDQNNRLEGRIFDVGPTFIELRVTDSEFNSAVLETNIAFERGLSIVRTEDVPQKIKVAQALYDIYDLAIDLNKQAQGVEFFAKDDQLFLVKSLNLNSKEGSVLLVDFESDLDALMLEQGDYSTAKLGSQAYIQNSTNMISMPSFQHDVIRLDTHADTPNSFISDIEVYSSFDTDPNKIVAFVHPFDEYDSQTAEKQFEISKDINSIPHSHIEIRDNEKIRRLREDTDRVYLAETLNFGAYDTMIVVLDKDYIDKTFVVPMYRRLLTNSSQPVTNSAFNAYDVDSGPNADLAVSFGPDFLFDDYKALMQAKYVLNSDGDDNNILFRAKQWGSGGENIKVGYFYPTKPDQDITSTVVVDKGISISIFLKSGETIAGTNIDGTTEWDMTSTPTGTPGVDEVTFTYNGTGTQPFLDPTLAGGEYITITQDSGFSKENLGTFKVVSSSPTSFSIERLAGTYVLDQGAPTLSVSAIQFYDTEETLAKDVVEYVNENLSDLISAKSVDDNGGDGDGEILYSTEYETNFVTTHEYLRDGINWILNTDLAGASQFTFKRPLAFWDDLGYDFREEEEIRLIPTTIDKLATFMNQLVVSGISTAADIKAVNNGQNLQIASHTLGSEGAVQVIGGAGSFIEGVVTDVPYVVNDRTQGVITVDRSTGVQLEGGQYIRLEAQNYQNKDIGLTSSTQAEIRQHEPQLNETTVSINNRDIKSKFFGHPRIMPRIANRSWRIEKQGDFSVLAYDALNGTTPVFERAADLNDMAGGKAYIVKTTPSEARVTISDGDINFMELSIGDFITITGRPNPENNGIFEIIKISNDKRTIHYVNELAITEEVETTITITDFNDVQGSSIKIAGQTKVEGVDWTVGVDDDTTATNLAQALSSIAGVNATELNNVITVVMEADQDEFIEYTPLTMNPGLTISDLKLQGPQVLQGDLSSIIGIKEGDSLIIKDPFSSLNKGTKRVVRVYNDSVYFESLGFEQESVYTPDDILPLTLDSSTELEIYEEEGFTKVGYTGIGTDPKFSLVKPGDILTLAAGFDVDNTNDFTVTGVSLAKKLVTDFTFGQNLIVSGTYGLISSVLDVNEYYFWFNVDGNGNDPNPGGLIPIEIQIQSTYTPSQVAEQFYNMLSTIPDFAVERDNNIVRVTNAQKGFASYPTNVDVQNLNVKIYQEGHFDTLEIINPKTFWEVVDNVTLDVSRPAILFYPYDSVIPGDKVFISGTILDEENEGKHIVKEVLSPKEVVLNVLLDKVPKTILGQEFGDLNIEEGIKFNAYKQIDYVAPIQGDLDNIRLVLTNRDNIEKINTLGDSKLSTVSRTGFDTKIRVGQDGYKYDVGLLAEVNRIIYGDPRDNSTYPGVGAAGVEIYPDPPLIRRVPVGIVVRVRTGIPFVQVVEQVRNSVSALISSQPIGQSIAISSIVATVNEIPGVFAVSISSPLYDPNSDVISISQNEKAYVIDPVADITVSEN